MNYAPESGLTSECLNMAVVHFNQEQTCVYEVLYVCIMYLALYLIKLQLEQKHKCQMWLHKHLYCDVW